MTYQNYYKKDEKKPEMGGRTIQKSKMAPSAVETATLTERPNVNPTVKLTGGIGPYKELDPIGYEKEAEEKGKDDFKPAKVDNKLFIAWLIYCEGKNKLSPSALEI